jgi:hypothetical protein
MADTNYLRDSLNDAAQGPRSSGHCASRSQGTDIGHTLAQEAPQAFTEAVVNVDSY